MLLVPEKINYWDELPHTLWQQHYVDGTYGGLYLSFSRQFLLSAMPPDMSGSSHKYELQFTILDKDTGKQYTCAHCVAYAQPGLKLQTLDENWNNLEVESLSSYFYGCHFCGCHVAHHIQHHSGQVIPGYDELPEDKNCERGRWAIVQCVWEKRPDLILISETMAEDELEAKLTALRGARG